MSTEKATPKYFECNLPSRFFGLSMQEKAKRLDSFDALLEACKESLAYHLGQKDNGANLLDLLDKAIAQAEGGKV